MWANKSIKNHLWHLKTKLKKSRDKCRLIYWIVKNNTLNWLNKKKE
jgi:hypothetical protein